MDDAPVDIARARGLSPSGAGARSDSPGERDTVHERTPARQPDLSSSPSGTVVINYCVPGRTTSTDVAARLVGECGISFALCFTSDDYRYTIGRSRQCHVPIDDPRVSRCHSVIGLADGELYIEDLNSTNGTYVNEVRVSGRSKIESGDNIRLGRTAMRIECD